MIILHLCNKNKKYIYTHIGRICSAHFDATAYKEPSWMQSVLGHTTPKKRTLKSDAVPTQNLNSSATCGYVQIASSSYGKKHYVFWLRSFCVKIYKKI